MRKRFVKGSFKKRIKPRRKSSSRRHKIKKYGASRGGIRL